MTKIIIYCVLIICAFIVSAKIAEHRKVNRFTAELQETIKQMLNEGDSRE